MISITHHTGQEMQMPNYNDIEKEIIKKKQLAQDEVRHFYMSKEEN